MKFLYFKYTYKSAKQKKADTYFIEARSEGNARLALGNHLKIEPSKFWLSPRNIPYKIRKQLMDKNNDSYKITIRCTKSPVENKTVEERQAALFGTDHSQIKSIKFKIRNLFNPTAEFFESFSYKDLTELYLTIRKEILTSELLLNSIYLNDITYLEYVDSYITNQYNKYDVRLFRPQPQPKTA